MVFVDGENLVLRYQSMAKSRTPTARVAHHRDVFVWKPLPLYALSLFDMDVARASYYTSMVGGDDEIERVKKEISDQVFCEDNTVPSLQAHVFKRDEKEDKSRIVDLFIRLDALHHAYGNHADHFALFTGDADLLPLVKTLMREGKQVTVFAFSLGLSPELEAAPDGMVRLNTFYFEHPT